MRHALEDAGAECIEGGVKRRELTLEEVEERYRAIKAIILESAAEQATHKQITDHDLYDENGLPA